MLNDFQKFNLRTGSWCGDQTFDISFPKTWQVSQFNSKPMVELSLKHIKKRFSRPVDNFKLLDLLDKDKKIAIIIDDHTRPTPVFEILKHVVSMIKEKGGHENNVKIFIALGTHVLEDKQFLKNKLLSFMDGAIEIVFPDCSDNQSLQYIGQSKLGIPVFINKEFANADVKIAISGIYPHDEAGFSGGAKIIIGVLGLRTLSLFHRHFPLIKRGTQIITPFREEIESFADLAKIDYSINLLINEKKEIAEVFCGNFRKAFRVAADYAQEKYKIDVDVDADIIISNSYPLDTSSCVLGKSTWPFQYSKKNSYRIMISSLSDQSGYRLPFSTSNKELFIQQLKKKLFLTEMRKKINNTKFLVRMKRNYDARWLEKYLIYVPNNSGLNSKIRVHEQCAIEYSWNKILEDLLKKFPKPLTPKVSVYSCAPLLFPDV